MLKISKSKIKVPNQKLQIILTSVTCALGPSVNPLQNREIQHVNIVLQCTYQFFE
jgi:hypothetical protein